MCSQTQRNVYYTDQTLTLTPTHSTRSSTVGPPIKEAASVGGCGVVREEGEQRKGGERNEDCCSRREER